jgi:hypothetical protein
MQEAIASLATFTGSNIFRNEIFIAQPRLRLHRMPARVMRLWDPARWLGTLAVDAGGPSGQRTW